MNSLARADLSLGHHAHIIELRTDQPVGETLSLGLRPHERLQRFAR